MAELASDQVERPWLSGPLIVGYLLTFVMVTFWLLFATSVQNGSDHCTTNWCVFWRSGPNEVGDTMAGLFGSLAFVWIVVTVFMQGSELAAQREELRLTRIEFQAMAKAQEGQRSLMSKQSEILEQEQIRRHQQEQNEVLASYLRSFLHHVRLVKGVILNEEYGTSTYTYMYQKNNDLETDLYRLSATLGLLPNSDLLELVEINVDLDSVLEALSKAKELFSELSLAHQNRYKLLLIDQLFEFFADEAKKGQN